MAMRCTPVAPVGSLLKGVGPKPKAKAKTLGRAPRERDDEHLEAVRQCPCLNPGCRRDPAGVAAHLRMSRIADGKPKTGMGEKPSDQWTAPLCDDCHTRQHAIGEHEFWTGTNVDPIRIAKSLYEVSPNVEAMRQVVFTAHTLALMED
jgi:hypothetical protein